MIQDSKLCSAGGSPRPQPLSCPVQSMALKWSPELRESASRDLLRSISHPAAQKAGDWPRVTAARHSVFMRTRSAMEVVSGSL